MFCFKKVSPAFIKIFLLALFVVSINHEANAQRYNGDPVTKLGLVQTLKGKQYQTRQIIAVILSQGVDFRLNSKIRKELVSAGARPDLLTAVSKHYRRPKRGRKSNKTRNKGGKYQNLLDEAMEKYNVSKDTKGSIEILEQAIKMKPRNSTAYQMLGFAYLDRLKNYKNAEKHMSKAIDLGGSAVFRVRHSHDFTFSSSCEGSMYVSKNDIRFESDTNIDDTFDIPQRDITRVRTLGGGILGVKKLFRFKGGAFKITIRDRKDKNKNDKDTKIFSPLSGKKKVSKMIIKLIGK